MYYDETAQIVVNGVVEMTAHWTPIQYTITFEENGGSAVNDITQAYNSAVTKPADPEKEGYTFEGWYSTPSFNAGSEVNWEGLTMPLNGANYYAQWTVNTYTITFNMDGGDFETLPTGFVKDGYDFAGWYSDAALNTVFTDWTFMPAEDLIVYAKWTEHEYTVTFAESRSTAY